MVKPFTSASASAFAPAGARALAVVERGAVCGVHVRFAWVGDAGVTNKSIDGGVGGGVGGVGGGGVGGSTPELAVASVTVGQLEAAQSQQREWPHVQARQPGV